MAYEEVHFDTPEALNAIIAFLDKNNLNDGESPVYLHFNQDTDVFIVSWPDPVPAHLRQRR